MPLARLVATDELLGLLDVLLLGLVLGQAAGHPLGPQLDVAAIVAGVLLQPPEGQFPHPAHHPVQEVAVVGHDHQAARPPDQVALQPLQGGQVQIVGRLVEEEKIGFLQEQPGQEGAGLLPAAQV